MTSAFKPCMNVLPQAQQRLWPNLGLTTKSGFVLYGGTAIALRLGHRSSVDFDFFSNVSLDREAISKACPFVARFTAILGKVNTGSLLVPDTDLSDVYAKVSFFVALDLGRVGMPGLTDDGVLQVASLNDLMATKLKVILQRAQAKDYRDIAAMINAGASLAPGPCRCAPDIRAKFSAQRKFESVGFLWRRRSEDTAHG